MCLFRYLGVTLHSNRTFFTSLQRLLTDNSMSHTNPKHETTKKTGRGVQKKNDVAIHLIYILERLYIRQGETINNSKKSCGSSLKENNF